MATKKCNTCNETLPAAAGDAKRRKRAWNVANPQKRQAASRRHARKHPDARWRRKLRQKYNLTPADYWQLYAEQDGKCGVCNRTETAIIRGKLAKLSVDHDHETGMVRGLLCSRCNRSIGQMDDDPALLRAGADWLETATTTAGRLQKGNCGESNPVVGL